MNIKIGILNYNSDIECFMALLKNYADFSLHNLEILLFQHIESLLDLSFNNLDYLFIDLDSSEDKNQNGIVLAKILRAEGFRNHIILISSNIEDAIKGYDVTATGFLTKPVSESKLYETLNRIIKLKELHCFRFKCKNDEYSIPYSTIISFEKEKHDLLITTDNSVFTVRESLKDILPSLPKDFIQCHRSCIINILKTLQINNNTVILSNNTFQRIGRKYRSNVINTFDSISTKGGTFN
ncbi:MAG: LytTR family transcriptional regulator DNA-binding domain-containing protein [Lachnospiraceae bacterium]|nr:LytTR family transcriptional regulator DNA-binding domain-containing protein [Lachnospiraceae bacterium]